VRGKGYASKLEPAGEFQTIEAEGFDELGDQFVFWNKQEPPARSPDYWKNKVYGTDKPELSDWKKPLCQYDIKEVAAVEMVAWKDPQGDWVPAAPEHRHQWQKPMFRVFHGGLVHDDARYIIVEARDFHYTRKKLVFVGRRGEQVAAYDYGPNTHVSEWHRGWGIWHGLTDPEHTNPARRTFYHLFLGGPDRSGARIEAETYGYIEREDKLIFYNWHGERVAEYDYDPETQVRKIGKDGELLPEATDRRSRNPKSSR
jgi:hypothetical protein